MQVNEAVNQPLISRDGYLWIGKIAVWLILLYISTFYYLQNIFFILSGIFFIFRNLGKKKPGDLSAYSVFNKDFKKIAGTMDADEMLMGRRRGRQNSGSTGRIFGEEEEQEAKKVDEFYKNPSKFGNKPCYCESGLKFKKCCFLQKDRDKQNKQV